MVWLHVLDNQVVRLPCAEDLLEIGEPFRCEMLINCIKNRDFLIEDHIRVIGHAVWNSVLPLKQIDLMIVDADILDVICNSHSFSLLKQVPFHCAQYIIAGILSQRWILCYYI